MMKNKEKLKKLLWKLGFTIIILIILFSSLNIYQYNVYKNNTNQKINSLIMSIKTKYPSVSDEEILNIINSNESIEYFSKYSLTLNNKSILKINDDTYQKFLIINITFLSCSFLIIVIIFLRYNYLKDKEIDSITKSIKKINQGNYKLNIDAMTEDELSILKSELYKIMVKLKESSLNEYQEKVELKNNLADISHQLKTPLTSILIILDNLIDNPNMDILVRQEFIREIKREILNISFLVESILKLSKLDSKTVKFNISNVSINYLIRESIKNVSAICDLKNIKINIKMDKDIKINCDKNWQIEALTNIIKNSLEYSKNNSYITINSYTNKLYSTIEIINYGNMISNSDLPHIFERFYKGKNSSYDSIGIGLFLSKKIVESNKGILEVISSDRETKFIIKYFY